MVAPRSIGGTTDQKNGFIGTAGFGFGFFGATDAAANMADKEQRHDRNKNSNNNKNEQTDGLSPRSWCRCSGRRRRLCRKNTDEHRERRAVQAVQGGQEDQEDQLSEQQKENKSSKGRKKM